MRSVYMMTDLEGVAGVVSFSQQSFPGGRYYDHAKRLLTAEVNAAVEGLLEAGVQDILVDDGHGAGGIWYEDMHEAARLLHGTSRPLQRTDQVARDCDACVMIGQHAMAGVAESNQNHTQDSRSIDYYKLNGHAIGEIAQFALAQGARDQPVVFVSGEQAACEEAEQLIPGITTVGVKQGLGRGAAVSLSAAEARRRIREGIQRAIARHQRTPIAPTKWEGPYVLEKRFFTTDAADADAEQAGAERVDGQTVRFRADDVHDVIWR